MERDRGNESEGEEGRGEREGGIMEEERGRMEIK